MSSDIVISGSTRSTILTLIQTDRKINLTTEKLATGLRVNSAIENPENFFTSVSLRQEASDYNRRIDGISQSIRTIEETLIGVDAIEQFLNQAETVVSESKLKLEAGETDPQVFINEVDTSPPSLRSQILQANPDVYYPLDDAGPTVDDIGIGGGVNATYDNGVTTGAPAIYSNGGTSSASFDGIDDFVSIDTSPLINDGSRPEKTVELVFNANNTAPRQTLYEEGAQVNNLNIYIEGGDLVVTGTDSGAWGPNTPGNPPNNIRAPINAGETYHVAFVFSSTENRFEGYLNGISIGSVTVANTDFPSHTGDVGVGAVRNRAWFDGDIAADNNLNPFSGSISDVAIYNDVLSDAVILSHAQSLNATITEEYRHRDLENILDQIDQITIDARYRGVNLLAEDDLTTLFNPDGSSNLLTEGVDFSSDGLGIDRFDFNDLDDLEDILSDIRDARERVRNYGTTLIGDLNIIQTRDFFTEDKINTLEGGSSDLILADANETSAELLALQTRQDLAFTALSLATQSEREVLSLF